MVLLLVVRYLSNTAGMFQIWSFDRQVALISKACCARSDLDRSIMRLQIIRPKSACMHRFRVSGALCIIHNRDQFASSGHKRV